MKVDCEKCEGAGFLGVAACLACGGAGQIEDGKMAKETHFQICTITFRNGKKASYMGPVQSFNDPENPIVEVNMNESEIPEGYEFGPYGLQKVQPHLKLLKFEN